MTDPKYPRERDLIPHYEAHPQYYSPVPRVMSALIQAFPLDMGAIRTVLDVGCGDGRLSLWLAQHYEIAATGVDYSPTRVAKATATLGASNLPCTFVCQDLHRYLEDCGATYDLIAAFEVLEHLETPSEVVRRCRDLLTDNGSVVGSVPKNMAYVAHLQVFKDVGEVRRRLSPNRIFKDESHWYCQWFKP